MDSEGGIDSNLVLATGFWRRLRGLLFSQQHRAVLLLGPCKRVHTFGMRYEIDVAFVDKDGRILGVCQKVPPNQLLKHRGAEGVLERFTCGDPWFKVGDRIVVEARKYERNQDCTISARPLEHSLSGEDMSKGINKKESRHENHHENLPDL